MWHFHFGTLDVWLHSTSTCMHTSDCWSCGIIDHTPRTGGDSLHGEQQDEPWLLSWSSLARASINSRSVLARSLQWSTHSRFWLCDFHPLLFPSPRLDIRISSRARQASQVDQCSEESPTCCLCAPSLGQLIIRLRLPVLNRLKPDASIGLELAGTLLWKSIWALIYTEEWIMPHSFTPESTPLTD